MKKILISIFVLGICMIIPISCKKVDTPVKYLTINGQKTDLKIALVDDLGTDNEITYRGYDLSFRSTETYPSFYIDFCLYSTSTTRIQEGTYTYQYSPIEAGTISYAEVGNNIQYDNDGEAISGTRILESNASFSGTVTVSMKDDNYYFTFDLTAIYNDITYTIEGDYNDVLVDD